MHALEERLRYPEMARVVEGLARALGVLAGRAVSTSS